MAQKYEEIKAFLKAEALKPESRLRMPTIQELMQRFRASQSPVSRAVKALEQENILYCRRGVGIVSRSGMPPVEAPPRPGKTTAGTVAFLLVDYFASTLWQMSHTLNAYARQLELVPRGYSMQRDSDRLAALDDVADIGDLRGVVLMSSADRLEAGVFDRLDTLGVPAVVLDSYFGYDAVPDNVSILRPDAYANGRACVDHFRAHGHRRVGLVRSAPDGTIPQLMMAGAADRAEEHGMGFKLLSGTIKSWDSSRDAARKITGERLAEIKAEGLTGLVYIGIGGAVAANRVFWLNGWKVPGDVSLIAHGDDPLLDDCTPAITATRTDFTRMSRDALDLVAGRLPRTPERLYPAELVERESVAPPDGSTVR